MKTELIIPGLGPSVNTTMGQHWHKKTKQRNEWQNLFRFQTRNQHPGRVNLSVFRHSTGTPMDHGNLVASHKHVIDAIVRNGIILDDSPKVIADSHYEHIRVARAELQKTVIVIEDCE